MSYWKDEGSCKPITREDLERLFTQWKRNDGQIPRYIVSQAEYDRIKAAAEEYENERAAKRLNDHLRRAKP